MHVVGEAANGREAIDVVLEHQPDVLVIDLQMPEMGGIEAIRLLSAAAPKTRSIALTMHDDPSFVRFVLAAGGAGYVPKRAAHLEILEAIRTVVSGRAYIDVSLGDVGGSVDPRLESDLASLSAREVQVLSLSAEGHTAQEIAARLDLSPKTVEGYRARIKNKLCLETRAELVRFALEAGLLRASPRLKRPSSLM